jgi:hypothetical protein
MTSSGLSLTVFIFAFLGSVVVDEASHKIIGGVLAFNAAALLYLR